jgi:MFS family permease
MTTGTIEGSLRRKAFLPTTIVLVLLCLMYGITYIDRVNVSTAASVFRKELGLNNTQVGLIFSAFAYPYLVFQVIGGWVGDRFGARRALTVANEELEDAPIARKVAVTT